MLPGGVFNTDYRSEIAVLRTRTQWVVLVIGLVVLFTAPLYLSTTWRGWLTDSAIIVVAVLGLHILTGLCGQISIGHAAFLAIGAYTVALLTTKCGLNGWLCLPLSGLAAGLVGLFFGLPSLRLRLFYLAISTLAASHIIVWCFEFEHFEPVTGGFAGLGLEPLSLGSIELRPGKGFYVLVMAVMVLATIAAKNIQRSSTGRAFVAIRDNELAAEVSGIAVFRYKMLAFFIGCVFAGVAGWLFAYSQLRVNPHQFGLDRSLWYVGMLIIGGWGSTTGVFFGVAFLRLMEALIDEIAPVLANAFPSIEAQLHISMSLIVYGVAIIAFMMLQPRGLYYGWEKLKAYYRLHPYSYLG